MSKPMVLYHYCSTEAFKAIIESKSVQLSSVTLSNDSAEGTLLASAFKRLAKSEGLAHDDTQHVLELMTALERWSDGLAFCMSEEGDLLSQWRAYASGATGISIGFSVPYITWLHVSATGPGSQWYRLGQVRYQPKEHEAEIGGVFREIVRHIDNGVLRIGRIGMLDTRTEAEREEHAKKSRVALESLSSTMLGLYPTVFLLKSTSFREEREWRLIANMKRGRDQTCSYRAANDKLIPFRTLDLSDLQQRPIVEVILGSKHITPAEVIENFLARSGFTSVTVRRSRATFR